MQQAARVSDRTAFFTTEVNPESDRRTGRLVEFGPTREDLLEPRRRAHRAVRHGQVRLMTTTPRPDERRPGAARIGDLRTAFHNDLDEIRDELARLAATVTETIPRATEILLARTSRAPIPDPRRRRDRRRVARARGALLPVLALQAPVATDLRQVVAALRMIAEVERSADLAVNICKAARRIYGHALDRSCAASSRRWASRPSSCTRRRPSRTWRATRAGPPRSTTWTTTSTACRGSSCRRSSRATRGGDRTPGRRAARRRRPLLRAHRRPRRQHRRAVRYVVTGWLPEPVGAHRFATATGSERPE